LALQQSKLHQLPLLAQLDQQQLRLRQWNPLGLLDQHFRLFRLVLLALQQSKLHQLPL
jgi:hypothetical protein